MERNNNLDFLKIILSFFVVAANTFPMQINENEKSFLFLQFQTLARLTIPLFLIITGFYIKDKIYNFKNILSISKRLFVIFIVWQLIYFKTEFNYYSLKLITSKQFYLDLFYGIAHLWYLIAVVQALFLVYLIRNFSQLSKFILAIILFFIGYFYQLSFDLKLLDSNSFLTSIYPYIGTTRNFLFYAFPYLIIGTCFNFWKNFVLKYNYLIAILAIGLFFESYFYFEYFSLIFNIFIFPLPISMFVFTIVLNYKKQIAFKVPKNLSLGIYLIHFYVLIEVFMKFNDTSFVSFFYRYLLICFFTIILCFILNKVNKKLPIFF